MKSFFLSLLIIPFFLLSNPFLIDFPEKDTLSIQDYLEVQEKLEKLCLEQVLEEFYPSSSLQKPLWSWKPALARKTDFLGRISKSRYQKLIDPLTGKEPSKHLEKIGKGGDHCIVCYVSLNGKYPDLLKGLGKRLEQVGFNGHLFYMIGGFPNPTGKEIKYCGVPYCFKIFTLLEAQKMGFQKVLWIDSAFYPLKDPTPLFTQIEQTGHFLKMHPTMPKYILPKTRNLILKETGVDVLKTEYVSAQVIGFDLTSPFAKEFISEYYRLVEIGYPFLSCFPEEYVFSAIVGKDLKKWTPQPFKDLSFAEKKLKGKDIAWAQDKGYFFLQLSH